MAANKYFDGHVWSPDDGQATSHPARASPYGSNTHDSYALAPNPYAATHRPPNVGAGPDRSDQKANYLHNSSFDDSRQPIPGQHRYPYESPLPPLPSSSQQHLHAQNRSSFETDPAYHRAVDSRNSSYVSDVYTVDDRVPLRPKGPGGNGASPRFEPLETGSDQSGMGKGGRAGAAAAAAADFDRQIDTDASNDERRPRGWKNRLLRGKVPWAVYILSLIQICVFIAEVAKNTALTGSPIEIHPSFNPMIGPSPYVLINMGARYVPCMRNTAGIQDSAVSVLWPCPNATSTTNGIKCSLSDLCGFSGVPNPHAGGSLNDSPEPNQWFRFILPIFLHAGLIHISFNLLMQLTLGAQMERTIGTIRFLVVYFSSGIFGFVLGGNYAANGIASTGASGSIFGIIALLLLNVLYTWRQRRSPVKDLLLILVDVVISFALGLLPGLDNFSHIGGFLMGLALGICLLHSPDALRQRIGLDDDDDGTSGGSGAAGYKAAAGEPRYASAPRDSVVYGSGAARASAQGPALKGVSYARFAKDPVGFFRRRKPLWWAWWLFRVGALVSVIVGFIILLNNFYKFRVQCGWCKYLSCININNWCDVGQLHFSNQTSSSGHNQLRRDLLPDL